MYYKFKYNTSIFVRIAVDKPILKLYIYITTVIQITQYGKDEVA
jgi:hypothetical protein